LKHIKKDYANIKNLQYLLKLTLRLSIIFACRFSFACPKNMKQLQYAQCIDGNREKLVRKIIYCPGEMYLPGLLPLLFRKLESHYHETTSKEYDC
jgi:hypothetical protein